MLVEIEYNYDWFGRNTTKITLSNDKTKYFIIDGSDNLTLFDSPVVAFHFECDEDDKFTEEEFNNLMNATIKELDYGTVVAPLGGISPGGISAYNKLGKYGLTLVGNTLSDEYKNDKRFDIYLGGIKLDEVRVEKWFYKHQDIDCIKIDNDKDITASNIYPIVKIW